MFVFRFLFFCFCGFCGFFHLKINIEKSFSSRHTKYFIKIPKGVMYYISKRGKMKKEKERIGKTTNKQNQTNKQINKTIIS